MSRGLSARASEAIEEIINPAASPSRLRPSAAARAARHRPARVERGADLDQLRRAYEGLGEPVAHFLAAMEKALTAKQAGYHARHILTLRERSDTVDLLPALAHAESFGAFEQFAAGRILLARAKPRRLDEYVAEDTARKLEHLIAKSSTEPRDLTEYDELPHRSGTTPKKETAPCPSPGLQKDKTKPQV